jgi:hypothetical protein
MQVTRIMHELLNLKQGTKLAIEYVGELKKLCRELHYYQPLEPSGQKDMDIHHT